MQVYTRPRKKTRGKEDMNMKKFFSLLMAALMMASVLAGCGGTEEAPAEDTQTPAEDTQTPAEGEATGTGTAS